MGGPGATDDLALGHEAQTWLAGSDDPEAASSGGYWYHRRRQKPATAAGTQFQDGLLDELARLTGVPLSEATTPSGDPGPARGG